MQHGAAVREGNIRGASTRAEHTAAAAAARAGCVVAAVSRCMPLLRALDVTMMPVAAVESVRIGLGQEHAPSTSGSPPGPQSACDLPFTAQHSSVQVWDLTQSEGVASAAQVHASAAAQTNARIAAQRVPKGTAGPLEHSKLAASLLPAECLRLGLRCAANCSNAARFSPLHLASVRGDACAVRQLLRLGAVSWTKNRGAGMGSHGNATNVCAGIHFIRK